MAHESLGVKEIIVTDGYAKKIEVEAAIAAAGRLASPGDVLYNVAHSAIETFGRLDYAAQRGAADLLAALLQVVLKEWTEEIDGFVVPLERKEP